MKATNIVWHQTQVSQAQREALPNQHGGTIRLTGLPSFGKSTTAYVLEYGLFERGFPAHVPDGDNVRHGLNRDLGFSAKDRAENIRRVAEAANLFADAGVLVITTALSRLTEKKEILPAEFTLLPATVLPNI